MTTRFTLAALFLVLFLAPLSAAGSDEPYTPAELEEIVAPIALYPDILISSMLPASTVPMDVVAAARWVGQQEGEITEAPADSGWDPAVEAMIQFPDVLTWMNENLSWMEMLAYAVAVQEGEVLQAIQDFRKKAQEAGNLESNDKMQVVTETEVIYIEPASPTVVYVPTYDPVAVVRPGYTWGGFWAGVAVGAVGAWAWHSIRWGDHGHGSINVNRNPTFNFNNNGNINRGNIGSGNRWKPANRPANRPTTRPSTRPSRPSAGRPGSRPRPGAGGVKPGTSRPGTRPARPRPGDPGRTPGTRPGTRPGAGRPSAPPSRPGTRPGAGRPSTTPSRPGTRPSTSPSRGNRSALSGSSRNGRSTRSASSRGRSSMSQGSSGRSRSSGSRGGSRGGGRRGGGGRR
jgi:hypothetical protein